MDTAVLLIVLPLLTAFSLGIIKMFSKKMVKVITVISATVHLALIMSVVREAMQRPIVYHLGNWDNLLGISLVIDSFSAMMALLIGVLAYAVIIYSLVYIDFHELKYYVLSFLLIAGVMGMSLTADLFNLYVFFEIVSITSYALVAIKEEEASFEGAFKYLVMGMVSGTFVLLAIILTYQVTGALNFAQVAANFGDAPMLVRQTIFVFFLIGFGTKFCLVPLHAWLPDVYCGAPASFNALSSGIVIKASLYAFIRIAYLLFGMTAGIGQVLIYWGVATFLVAHILAYQQENLKRLLGYSSIAQIGYILLAIGLGTESGIIAGSYHIFNDGLMKATLFLGVGIFSYTVGASKIDDLRGLGFSMPKVSFAFVIATLAIIGLPPFNGFISKWLILQAAWETEYIVAAFFIPVGSLLSLAYYLKLIKALYSKADRELEVKPIDWKLRVPTYVLAASCLVMGIIPGLSLVLLENIPKFLLDSSNYINLLLGR
ncbi:complex I subunit 5 family protein [Natroniella sp. ANB-PHB2]|uniref:complex I subunit 5 family protein n=1 Tax=Natroniella sp. ANB-PHB2 TaxID=3384444 RepID=UPI0038D4ADAF